jgi:hypothetical protein
MAPGDQRTFMLNEGDLLQLETLMAGDDLTGTYVESDKPVALFAGVECAVNPAVGMGQGNDCDHMEEQILPLIAWGKNYVAPRIAGQSTNCTGTGGPELSCSPSVFRILASEAGTTVTLNVPTGVTVTPPGPFTLGPGMVQEVVARGSSIMAPGDFFISANKPIFVMQMAGGEPAMVTAVPVEQYLPQYLFEVTDFFCTTLTVSRKMGQTVLLDGMAIADSLFTPAGGGYEVARMPLNQGMCGVGSPGNTQTHTIKTPAGPDGKVNPAGIDALGVDINCSYGYVGGLSITVINPVE